MPIQLPALGIQAPQQPDLLGQFAKIQQLKTMAGQQQIQQQTLQENALDIKQKERDARDQQAMTSAMQEWDGKNFEELPAIVNRKGGSAKAVLGLRSSIFAQKKEASEIAKNDAETGSNRMKTMMEANDQMAGRIGSVLSLPDNQLAAGVQQAAQQSTQDGLLDPQHAQMVQGLMQLPPDQMRAQLQYVQKGYLGQKAQQEAAVQQETARHNQAMEGARSTEPVPLVKNGKLHSVLVDKKTGDEVKDLGETRQPNAAQSLMTNSDAEDIANAIANGDQPPTLQGLYRNAGPVRAKLARMGVPLAKMETDWKATQKYVGTLNGTQQVRLRQAIETASDSADKIDQLYKEYHSIVGDAGMKAFNKAGLAAAKQLPGRAGAVATALDAQIADLTSELGNVYMGGNSPTDHSLSLAGKNLSSDWNRETFEEGIKQVHLNIGIRKNSITHAMPAGLSGDSNYFKPDQGGANPTSAAAANPTAGGFSWDKMPEHK